MAPPPPPARGRIGLLGALFILIAGVFVGSSLSTCASMRANEEGPFAPDGPRVGVVEVLGPIMESRDTVEQLARFSRNEEILAVVVRIDSPGGAVGPSQEIYEAMRRTAAVKPVIASMGAVAASGGYWIALAAEKIYANPGTITGSIGVIVQTPDLTKIAEMLRFDLRTYKSGEHKDIGNPFREPSPGDVEIVHQLVQDVYEQFVTLTAERRNLPLDRVRTLADGRILSGRDAQEQGLIDRLGGLETASRFAVARATDTSTDGEEGEAPILVYPPDPVPPFLELLGLSLSEAIGRGLATGVERGVRALSEPAVDVR